MGKKGRKREGQGKKRWEEGRMKREGKKGNGRGRGKQEREGKKGKEEGRGWKENNMFVAGRTSAKNAKSRRRMASRRRNAQSHSLPSTQQFQRLRDF